MWDTLLHEFFSLLTDLQSSENELARLEIPEEFPFCFSYFDGDTIQGNRIATLCERALDVSGAPKSCS